MDLETRVERAGDLPSAVVDRDIVFLNTRTDSYIALDVVGRRIWELLEEPRTVAGLVDALAGEFAGERERIASDVLAFLRELQGEGMVRVTSS